MRSGGLLVRTEGKQLGCHDFLVLICGFWKSGRIEMLMRLD